MLTQKVSLVLTGLATLALAAGCTIKSVDTSNTSESTTNGVTSSSSSGAGGAGGASSSVGVGGSGGGASSSVGVGGSGGGAPSCYSDTALLNSLDASSCKDTVGIELASDNCGPGYNEIVPGKDVCAMGFEVFTKGAAQVLEACLAEIPAQKPESCDQALVDACVGEMTESACANSGADTLCDSLNTGCGSEGTFDADLYAACKVQLKPFNQGSLDEFLTCFNSDEQTLNTCADAYYNCLDAALALPE